MRSIVTARILELSVSPALQEYVSGVAKGFFMCAAHREERLDQPKQPEGIFLGSHVT